jgi:hypothetical protein
VTSSRLIHKIVDHARRLYPDDIKRTRYSYAITQAARLVGIETGEWATIAQKQAAQIMLEKGIGVQVSTPVVENCLRKTG